MARLTCDWDEITERKFKKRIKIIKEYFPEHKKEAFKTKKGYHVIIQDIDCNPIELALLRELFWDDLNRITIDSFKKISPKGVLWTEKNGFKPTRVKI